MADIVITYRTGEREHYKDNGHPGGSYEQTAETTDGWLTITKADGSQKLIPSDAIGWVEIHSYRRTF